MNLRDIVSRNMDLQPWAEGEKIPWNDPDFSRRMLREHLTQQHDAASRRTVKIKTHVNWIHKTVLAGTPSHILDLGCGPGLYCAELATRGHTCRGIDFSPASIDYAVKHAPENCSYALGDVRTTDFGTGFDLVMFIFGEMNVFKRNQMKAIVKKAQAALKPGGTLLLELSTYDSVFQIGNQPSMWYSAASGLFSDAPHLCLTEAFWDEEQAVATERFLIIDAESGAVTRYAASTQAYTEDEIESVLGETGYGEIAFHPSLMGRAVKDVDDFWVVTARK